MSRTPAVAAVGWVLLGWAVAGGQQPPIAPMLQQLVTGRVPLAIVSGRVVNPVGWPPGRGSSQSGYPGTQEELSYSGGGSIGSFRYRRTGPQGELSVELDSEGRFHFLRNEKERTAAGPVDLVQAPGEPVLLTVGPAGRQQAYRAATLWHLAVTEPEVCRRHVYPVLETMRPQWQLARKAAQVETLLVKHAAEDRQAERQQWADLVAELAGDQPAKREAAERRLRAGGTAALAYLGQLDLADLEAEQQLRIRRILRSAPRHKTDRSPPGQKTDDAPEQVARLLADDPSIWLALLGRPDPAVRRAAAKRLGTLLGEPLQIDPAADPASQGPARDALRARIEKAGGRGQGAAAPGKSEPKPRREGHAEE